MRRLICKIFFITLLFTALLFIFYFGYPFTGNTNASLNKSDLETAEYKRLQNFGSKAKLFCKHYGYNCSVCFLVDMSMPSGKNRFFVYDMNKDSITDYGLVAHGSCNSSFLPAPKFSNEPGCGCSSIGKYKTGNKYKGQFGIAYKLFGLDSTNNNACRRNIVLHSYYLVPEKEVVLYRFAIVVVV